MSDQPGSIADYMTHANSWIAQTITDLPLAGNNQKAQIDSQIAYVYAVMALVKATLGTRS